MPHASAGEIMGANVRRLRGEHTAEQLASHAQGWGLKWGSARISELEAGRISPTITLVYWLTLSLSDLLDRHVSPGELFEGVGKVTSSGDDIELALLRSMFSEHPRRPVRRIGDATKAWIEKMNAMPEELQRLPAGRVHKTRSAMTEADFRVASSLGLDRDVAAFWMYRCWGKPMSSERDGRAAGGMSAQQRGVITRQLKEELRKAVGDGDDL